MALPHDYRHQDCSIARALELIGERWTPLILRDAFFGVRRFCDFQAHLDVPRAVLTSRLQALVDAGVLARHRYCEAPPRDEYLLTPMGRELWPVLYALGRWGDRHLSEAPRRLWAHAPCGLRLDPGGACPEHGTIPVHEVVVLPGPGVDLGGRDDLVSVALRRPHRLLTDIREPAPA
jgi:DNA-binding HxlR family transcriptional regulator